MGYYMCVSLSFCIFVIGFKDFGKFLKKKKIIISVATKKPVVNEFYGILPKNPQDLFLEEIPAVMRSLHDTRVNHVQKNSTKEPSITPHWKTAVNNEHDTITCTYLLR